MLSHEQLLDAVPRALETVDLGPEWGPKIQGKVRDSYERDNLRVLITTDRVSAFDRVLGLIPYKGQMLNQLSAWWFEQTAPIVANHLVAVPDPNVTIARKAEPLPVEVVVRGYITGVTTTSLWYLYEQGERRPYGVPLPDGLRKNDRLPQPIITPTTKAADGGHDQRLTRSEIIEQGILPTGLWDEIEATALALFALGQATARASGLILVDTKYEFGLVDGQLTLIDEIHTPDSSRYWDAASYTNGHESPDHFDKEYLRQWYAAQGYRGDGEPPAMTPDLQAAVAARYMVAFERLVGRPFQPAPQPAAPRIQQVLAAYIA